MINHCSKSPIRRHKRRVSRCQTASLCLPLMIYSASERLRSARLSATESENCLEMPNWQRPSHSACHTHEKLQYGHVLLIMTRLTPASFSHYNGHPVSDELHKSNRLSVCLPAGVGVKSETAVSVPASCSLPLCAWANLSFPTFLNSAPSLSSS